MVNLLSSRRPVAPLPALTTEQRDRIAARWRRVGSLSDDLRRRIDMLARTRLEAELDELESEPALESALSLLARLDGIREEVGGGGGEGPEGPEAWLVYWPGRSLASGEAEVASRGYLDVVDRPPLADWLEVLARPTTPSAGRFEIAILVGVRGADRARAEAGLARSPTRALEPLEAVPGPLAEQLRPRD